MLQEEVGYPWTNLIDGMFKFGGGGVASWGTLCGALTAGAYLLNLTVEDYTPLVNQMMGWYTEFPFPSNRYEDYCKFPGQVTTIAGSPLCHVSVSTWATAQGTTVSSDEKKDRCAKVSGDVAAYVVELLNSNLEGNFIASYEPGEEFAACLGCHGNKGRDDQQGKMDCTPCHTDAHK